MRTRIALALCALALLFLPLVAACKAKPREPEPAAPPSVEMKEEEVREPEQARPFQEARPAEEPIRARPSAEADDYNRQGVLKTIYFDFDQYNIKDEFKQTLRQNADWIRDHPEFNVVIEGHCDERGTNEYNLALGDRRAGSTRQYLTSLGVPANRLRTITYGEERPAVNGHDESAWSRNRRAQFLIVKP
jgi:peptidoglycan-associated lipoprotein